MNLNRMYQGSRFEVSLPKTCSLVLLAQTSVSRTLLYPQIHLVIIEALAHKEITENSAVDRSISVPRQSQENGCTRKVFT